MTAATSPAVFSPGRVPPLRVATGARARSRTRVERDAEIGAGLSKCGLCLWWRELTNARELEETLRVRLRPAGETGQLRQSGPTSVIGSCRWTVR